MLSADPALIEPSLAKIERIYRVGNSESGPWEKVEGIDTEGCRVVYSDMQNPDGIYTKTSFYESGRKEYTCGLKNGVECGAYTSYHDLDGSPVEIKSTANAHDPEEFVGDFKRFAADGVTLVEQTTFDERGREIGDYFVIDANNIRTEGTHDPNGSGMHVGMQRKKDADGNVLVELDHSFDPKPRPLAYFCRFADNSTLRGSLDSFNIGPKDIFHLLQTNHSGNEFYFGEHAHDYFIGDLEMCWPDGTIKRKCHLMPSKMDEMEKIESGLFVETYQDGTLKRIGDTHQGTDFGYYPNGKPQSEKVVDNNRFIMTKEWDTDGNIILTHHHGKGVVDITVKDIYNTNKKLLSKRHFIAGERVNIVSGYLLQMIERNRYDIVTLDVIGIGAEEAAKRVYPLGLNLKG